MPQTNQVLKIVTSLGEMDFQLLNNYTPDTVDALRKPDQLEHLLQRLVLPGHRGFHGPGRRRRQRHGQHDPRWS